MREKEVGRKEEGRNKWPNLEHQDWRKSNGKGKYSRQYFSWVLKIMFDIWKQKILTFSDMALNIYTGNI